MKNQHINVFTSVALLMVFGILCRFLPHPANFAPIGAIAIFCGIYLKNRLALALPLVAMLLSDFFIGFYSWPIMLAVYLSFLLMAVIGKYVSKNKKFRTILGGTVIGSTLFFLITNWTVWAFGTMYEKNLNGLMECWQMAIPFWRNSLLGDLFYTFLLVSSMELAVIIKQKKLSIRQVFVKN